VTTLVPNSLKLEHAGLAVEPHRSFFGVEFQPPPHDQI
jgi:hypothetical protein